MDSIDYTCRLQQYPRALLAQTPDSAALSPPHNGPTRAFSRPPPHDTVGPPRWVVREIAMHTGVARGDSRPADSTAIDTSGTGGHVARALKTAFQCAVRRWRRRSRFEGRVRVRPGRGGGGGAASGDGDGLEAGPQVGGAVGTHRCAPAGLAAEQPLCLDRHLLCIGRRLGLRRRGSAQGIHGRG